MYSFLKPLQQPQLVALVVGLNSFVLNLIKGQSSVLK